VDARSKRIGRTNVPALDPLELEEFQQERAAGDAHGALAHLCASRAGEIHQALVSAQRRRALELAPEHVAVEMRGLPGVCHGNAEARIQDVARGWIAFLQSRSDLSQLVQRPIRSV